MVGSREAAGRRVAGWTAGSKALEVALQAALFATLPVVLGPVRYGDYALVTSIAAAAALMSSLAGPTVFGRFIPMSDPAERLPVASALLRHSAHRRLLLLGPPALLLWAVSVPLEELDARLVGLGVAILALEVLGTLAHQVALGLGAVLRWNLRYPVHHAVLLAAVPFVETTADALLATGIALAAAGLLAAPAALRVVAVEPVEAPRDALSFGRLSAVGAALTHLPQRAGVLAVTVLGGAGAAQAAGHAGLALGVSLAGTSAIGQLFTVELARRSAALAEGRARTLAAVERTAVALVVVAAAAGAAGVVLIELLLVRVLGPAFAGAVVPMQVALATWPLFAGVSAGSQVAALVLRPALRLRAMGISVMAYLALVAALVPSTEARGAAWALVAATGVAVVAQAWRPALLRPRTSAAAVAGALVVIAARGVL
jgi:O-antigen/teichoic acid export membrane protein